MYGFFLSVVLCKCKPYPVVGHERRKREIFLPELFSPGRTFTATQTFQPWWQTACCTMWEGVTRLIAGLASVNFSQI